MKIYPWEILLIIIILVDIWYSLINGIFTTYFGGVILFFVYLDIKYFSKEN